MQAMQQLLDIMAQLRDPETGCPWDIQQSFATIAPYTIEEAYEVADAIEKNDPEEIRDELGDLLLQVVFHAQMAQEKGWFDFGDIAQTISNKMIRRHPHVFGESSADTAEDVAENWEAIKQQEKLAKGKAAQYLLDDIPNNLPGLIRAVKLTKKAAKVGFDWPDVQPVLDKVEEEIDELKAELTVKASHNNVNHHHDSGDNDAQIEAEFGDILFALANVGRHLNIDPEKALRGTNQKFIRRFAYIENNATQPLHELSLEEMDTLWEAAKRSGL